ncbi:uncharacterized protein [Argopecten irradians]|uniref:uncharacterized protein n=1 Tax=Argopecten irradians TaxID=31199 RepID=UPI00370FC049
MFSWLSFLALLAVLVNVNGHGRLWRPPQRGSVWRLGNNSQPRNYDDMSLFCGGKGRQYDVNGGKCGTCGDPYDGVREHELGGKYGTGFISYLARYTQGQVMPIEVDVTANHKGWFEFRICEATDNNTPVTQDCLDQNRLTFDDGSDRFTLAPGITGPIPMNVRLPPHLTCNHCVLQWWWTTGNSGKSPRKETFVNCADVSIQPAATNVQPTPSPPTPAPTTTTTTTTTVATTTTTLPPITTCYPGQSQVCKWNASVSATTQASLDAACTKMSTEEPTDFFRTSCRCHCEWSTVPRDCGDIPRTWENIPNPDPLCAANCGQCPTSHCRC